MYLGELIKEYRERENLTMAEFALKCGLSKGYISMLEKNKHPQNDKEIVPSVETLGKVSAVLGISLNELLSILNDDQLVDISHDEQKPNRIMVYGSIPAGIPIEAVEDIVDWEDIPMEWLKGDQRYIGLRVKGDSMFPKYIEGDTIIVRLQPDCESGQDAVVYVNGYDATLKKVVKNEDGIMLQPLNPEYVPKQYDYNDERYPISILGVVVEIRRKV